MMIQMPVITAIKPERRSKGLDDLRCWHVAYRFCGLTAEIIVYAQDDAEARAKAVQQLRVRGLARRAASRRPGRSRKPTRASSSATTRFKGEPAYGLGNNDRDRLHRRLLCRRRLRDWLRAGQATRRARSRGTDTES
jgi:hypothetical protein